MADTLHTFSPSTSVLQDMSKNQTTKDVVFQEPSYNGSPLNNTCAPDKMQRQPQCKPTPYFIGSQATTTQVHYGIKSYTTWSILNIFCCCLCLGCLAYYYSEKTEGLKQKRNIQGAVNASKKARIINIIATVSGIIFIISVLAYSVVVSLRSK